MRFFFKTSDIEDIAKAKIVPKPEIQRSDVSMKSVEDKKPELKIDNCPSPNNNFDSWLKH